MTEDTIAHVIASQMLAGLYMLRDCIDRCPDKEWNEGHSDYPFSQVVFHTLFDCDYSLSDNEEKFKEQAFHKDNKAVFGAYEELEAPIRNLQYERGFLDGYYEHCVGKIASNLLPKNDHELIIPNSDIYKNMTKLERGINAIRHIQHHTAQLGLKLQIVTSKEMNWISRGFEK